MKRQLFMDTVISILLDYPELNYIKYEAAPNVLVMEIALYEELMEEKIVSFLEKVHQSLAFYNQMAGLQPDIIDLEYSQYSGITFIRISCDAYSVSKKEIELIMRLIKEEFKNIVCRNEIAGVKQKTLRTKIKHDILREITNNEYKNFSAYRDRGRLYVINN